MINARAETIASSSAYARPFAQRRCLVPADGWYEWQLPPAPLARPLRRGTGKQPYFITPSDGSVLAFAGVWTAWSGRGSGDSLLTFSVVTTAAIGDLALVHDRMPLVLPPRRWSSWLAGAPGEDLLAPAPQEYVAGLEIRPVGPAVGDVHNDGPSLLTRVDAPPLTEPAELRLF
jgi:putative SOS response-associated peptidase YedK